MSQLIPISPTSASNFKQKLYQFTQQNPGIVNLNYIPSQAVETKIPYSDISDRYSIKTGIIFTFEELQPDITDTYILSKFKSQTYGLQLELNNQTITGKLIDQSNVVIDSISYPCPADLEPHSAMIGCVYGKLILCVDGKISEKDTIDVGQMNFSSQNLQMPYRTKTSPSSMEKLVIHRLIFSQSLHVQNFGSNAYTYMKQFMLSVCSGTTSLRPPYNNQLGGSVMFDFIFDEGFLNVCSCNKFYSGGKGGVNPFSLSMHATTGWIWKKQAIFQTITGYTVLSQNTYFEPPTIQAATGGIYVYSILDKQTIMPYGSTASGTINVGSNKLGLSQLAAGYNILSTNQGIHQFNQGQYALSSNDVLINKKPDKARVTSDTYSGYIYYSFTFKNM